MTDLAAPLAAAGLLAPGADVVVLYSGGRDSTCLLDCAARIAGPRSVHALHVNYGLREEADADEAHCRRRCGELGVGLTVHRVTRTAAAGNLQAWARDVRYAVARELAGDRRADIAAGHTADDQVETILYRLASSPSRRALLGMRPREGEAPALLRPLLAFTRQDTTEHCRTRGLGWRDDAGNETGRFARGRVRHGLLPALRDVHPAAVANVAAVAEILAAEAEVLDELVDRALGGRSEIAVSDLRAQPPALQRLIVQRLADRVLGAPAAGVARRAAEVARLPERGTASLDLPSGIRATVRRGIVYLEPTPPLPRARALDCPSMTDDPAIGEILVAEDDLNRRVRELAKQISSDYAGRDLLLIGVLKGAVFFVSDLMRQLEITVEVDFMAVASYGSATRSSGVVRILKDLDAAIEGRDVLIVEDIVDSGLTLQYLLRNLAGRNPRSLEVCALLVKPARQKVEMHCRYVGFEIPDEFVIGYGLDHAERYRNLPYVAVLQQ